MAVRPRRRGLALVLVLLVVGAVVALAVSGDDSDDTPATEPTPAPAPAPPSYANPLVEGVSRNPSVLRAGDGAFYAYVDGIDLGGPFPVVALTSTDLATWTMVGDVLVAPGAWADPSLGSRFTSPSVRHVSDNPAASRYVMYLSGPTADGSATCIGVATAPGPEGPFVGADQPLVCPPGGARAASPVPGSDQIVYRADWPVPGVYGLRLDAAGTAVAPGAQPTLLLGVAGGVLQEGVLERPAVARDPDGGTYLFVRSGGAGDGVSWSRCRTVGAEVTTCANRTSFGTWLAPTGPVGSIGGLQVFTDGDGAAWIAYDAQPASACTGATCTGLATLRIDRLCFAHGQPRTNGPSTGPQATDRPADCSTDVPGASLDVMAVDDSERIDRAMEVSMRDGASAVPLGGRLLWLFGEAFIDPATGGPGGPCRGQNGSVGNSAALGLPNPLAGHRGFASPLRRGGPEGRCTDELIPFLEEERDDEERSEVGLRVAYWARGGIPLDDGSALVFFVRGVQDLDADGSPRGSGPAAGPDPGCSWCFDEDPVQGVVRLTPGQTVAERSNAAACAPTCLFGPADDGWSGWPFLVDDVVYLYAEDPDGNVRLGRVPLAEVEDRSAWTFRTADGGWSSAIADAAPTPGLFRAPVGVAYDGYLDRFVTVTNTTSDVVAVQTAPEPWGPWGDPIPVYDWSDVECADVDSETPVAVPWLDDGGGRVMHFTFSRASADFGLDPACPGEVRLVSVTLA